MTDRVYQFLAMSDSIFPKMLDVLKNDQSSFCCHIIAMCVVLSVEREVDLCFFLFSFFALIACIPLLHIHHGCLHSSICY